MIKDSLVHALAATPWTACAAYAVTGAVLGAVLTPLFLLLAIKLNYRRLGDAYASFPQDGTFFRLFAYGGAALFGIIAGSQPMLEAAGPDEMYIRGAMIPLIMLVVGWPFVRALKRLRAGRR